MSCLSLFLWQQLTCQEVLLVPRMNVMLEFISMATVDLPGARRKRQNTKRKILADSGNHNLEISTGMLYRLSYPGLMKSVLLKWPLYIHALSIPMYIHWFKFENDEVERIWSFVLHIGIYTQNQWKRNTCVFDIFPIWTCQSQFWFHLTIVLYIFYQNLSFVLIDCQ